jgi:hypothetical protein
MSVPETDDIEDEARRIAKMIQRLDVDVLELAYARLGAIYADTHRVCSSCESAAECSRWLAVAPQHDERPAFCPNLPVFERFVVPSSERQS